MTSTLVSGTTFKFIHGFLDAKSVSKDNIKLFCMEFAFLSSLNTVFLVELTSFICLASLKIAKSLVVSESNYSPAAIALHDMSLNMSAANIKSVLSVFGEVSYVMLKPAGKLDAAAFAFTHWLILVGKNSVCIFLLINQNKTILFHDQFKTKLVNLPSDCIVFEISDMIFQVGDQTCFILHLFDSVSLPLPPKTSKVFRTHFVSSIFYAKAFASLDSSEFSPLTAPISSSIIVGNLLVSFWLASLKSDLIKLSALVKSIIKPVGSLVKLFKQFINTDLVSSSKLGLKVNEVMIHLGSFSKIVAEKEIGHNYDSRKTTTITIKSLSIIQRTSQQNLQINQNLQIQYLQNLIHGSIILQRTSTNNTKPKVAESEIIGANYLGFAKFLFQHYCQYLGLNHNHISAESAFNFYVDKKIFSLLETPVNTESERETFYKELIQNTNLLTNHNFAFIITEINKEIEHYIQQRYLITYTSKDKGKLQTLAVTPRKIQPPAWKKNRVEFSSNPLYHYIPRSTINISSTDTFSSTVTSTFGQFPFQNRQKKTELLGPYDEYFERFNLQSSTPLGLQLPLPPPDFGISDPWEAAKSEKEEEESKDQEFTYLHPITENPEVETPNIQTQQQLENPEIKTPNIRMPLNQRNKNPELINQQNLPPVIIINQLPINPIAKPIQQPLQLLLQQPGQQQLLQQPPQPPNLDSMAYAPIAKLDNFMGEENDTQIWLNDSLINKPQDFNVFKVEFLRYFSNNNSINCLVNTFITMKQGETEAVTTYLRRFYQNLCQIQAIDTNYFTAPQILNQFIHGLRSSILQHVRPLHPGTLQDIVTCARDFESAESEANHTQAINLVMNGSFELDSKLEKFSESINKRLERYLTDNYAIYQPPQ
ncbi:hypothetical protein G9A89_021863 [Geosiphon pyriformis]|nr:hypothetical protein G9A89_021863 [Geosiphon pyriformis]